MQDVRELSYVFPGGAVRNDIYPSCSVIILNYNNRPHLEKCLPSVVKTEYRGPLEITVIDNGSSDDSVSFVQSRYPGLTLIRLGQNIGFASAYNRAVSDCRSELICLLNNDVETSGRWLELLADKLLSDEKNSMAMPKMLDYYDRSILNAAGTICDIFGLAFNRGIGQKNDGRFEGKTDIFYACGACALIRKKTLETAGSFDERYFMYHEDVDLSWRLRTMGYRITYVPEAIVFHMHMGSTLTTDKVRGKIYEFEKNRLMSFIKNYSLVAILILGPLLIMLISVHVLYALIKGVPDEAGSLIRALAWNIKNLPGTLSKRRVVQKGRTVSDLYVMKTMAKTSLEIGLGLGLIKHPIVHSRNENKNDTTINRK
jgi:hypothetical protein